MKIKTGDKVKIQSGKDKGKVGKVLQIFTKENRIVVEGLNLLLKHQKARKQGETGQRIQFPGPMDISNVELICPKCGEAVRVGFKVEKNEAESGKRTIKNRVCRKCKEII
ncbi:MAG: 50S ribosomal protein L24 [Candidatus Buchananbacteria bacterium]